MNDFDENKYNQKAYNYQRNNVTNIISSKYRYRYPIGEPVKSVRTYHTTLPICRSGRLYYITYQCNLDLKDSYLCSHSNMGITSKKVFQSRYWNSQTCNLRVVLTSLQGFYKDKFYDSEDHKRQNTYAPINHESLTYMFDSLTLKSFPSVVYMQVNNRYLHDIDDSFSTNDVLTSVTTHTLLFGYIKRFRIILSHNPILEFTIQDCLQHSVDEHTSEYSDSQHRYHNLGNLFPAGSTKDIIKDFVE